MHRLILSVSYDESLLKTRQAILSQAGYEVLSVNNYAKAVEVCRQKFDLILLGHSIGREDAKAIITELRKHGCDAPVLALLRPGELPFQDITRAVEPDPRVLLEAVEALLQERKAEGA